MTRERDPGSQRVDTGQITRYPYATRDHCANGHLWTPETTRWRKRGRGGRHGLEAERDCLVCKAVSEGKRRQRKATERRWM